MKGPDLVWDKEKLDRFITNPDAVVPGNNMKPYGGLGSVDDRPKVIAFLDSLKPVSHLRAECRMHLCSVYGRAAA
jgi:cytochrome c2